MTNSSSLLTRIRDRNDVAAWTLLRQVIERLVRSYVARRAEAAGADWRPPRLDQLVQDVLVHLWLKLPALDLDQGTQGLRQSLFRVVMRCLAQQEAERKFRLLDGAGPPTPEPLTVPADDSGDTIWQEQFARALLLVAMSELRDERARAGDPSAWAAFEKHWLNQKPAEDVAAELKMDEPRVFATIADQLSTLNATLPAPLGESEPAPAATGDCLSTAALIASLAASPGAEPDEHLEECPSCNARRDALVAQRAQLKAAWPEPRPQNAAPVAPTFLGKYFVAGTLRGNEKYVVYRAADAELNRDIALQLALAAINEEPARRAVVDEGTRLMAITHPSVSRVLAVEFIDHRPMIITEFVRGPAINDVEQLGSHKAARSAAWVSQLAEAMSVVHEAGVWHLDIQPRHVRIDETGRPRLLMLGSAPLQQIRHGAIPEGDSAFLSPEQARGDRDAITAAADVFSLGALLFHLLTGDVPYPGDNREQIRQAAHEGRVDLEPLDRVNVTARLRKLVGKALSVDPARRPDDLNAWAEQLQKSTKPGFIARMLGQ